MTSLAYYSTVALILLAGMFAALSVADRALHREAVAMQEGQ